MDGVSQVLDHDRWFKELLTTFFEEFLDLFFPALGESLDRDSLEFLSQELFVNQMEGEEYRADIVAKARFRDSAAFLLVHVEHQSTAPPSFPRRFFRYYSALFEKHDLPVYPIVIYSHDAPRKKQANVFRIAFPDGEVLRFRYRVVQLNRLPWRRFVNTQNPVASALMSKMRIAPRDRPRVKLECMRLLLTLKLDRARMKLIASFVDAYLSLNDVEERRFQRSVARARLEPEQRREIMEYVTSWERRGIEKGLLQGRAEGREEGREQGREQGLEEGVQALRSVLVEVLVTRFGSLPEAVDQRIRELRCLSELRRLTHEALVARALSDLRFS